MSDDDDLVMCLGDLNGHVGMHMDVFYGIHAGYGVGQKKWDGKILLEYSMGKELCV